MRSGLVKVLDIRIEYAVELLLMQDEQVIKALTTHTAEKPLTDGIRSRSVIRCSENLDVTCFRNPREAQSKLAIVIPNEILRTRSIGGGFPKLLCGPSVGGRACHADMDHFARVQFDNEEGEQRAEEEIGDWETRRRPRSAQYECGRRSSSFALVALQCAEVSCPSGSCASLCGALA